MCNPVDHGSNDLLAGGAERSTHSLRLEGAEAIDKDDGPDVDQLGNCALLHCVHIDYRVLAQEHDEDDNGCKNHAEPKVDLIGLLHRHFIHLSYRLANEEASGGALARRHCLNQRVEGADDGSRCNGARADVSGEYHENLQDPETWCPSNERSHSQFELVAKLAHCVPMEERCLACLHEVRSTLAADEHVADQIAQEEANRSADAHCCVAHTKDFHSDEHQCEMSQTR